jgi:hypothetical protein
VSNEIWKQFEKVETFLFLRMASDFKIISEDGNKTNALWT